MNLGIDFDGVITDPVDLKREWIWEKLGKCIRPEETVKKKATDIIGKATYRQMIDDIYGGSWYLRNKIRQSAINTMHLLRNNGHRLFIITSRFDNEAICAQDLIRLHDIPHDGFFNTQEKPKDQLCRQLRINSFVDDSQSKLDELRVLPEMSLLFFNVFNEKARDGILSVTSWKEYLIFINSLQENK